MPAKRHVAPIKENHFEEPHSFIILAAGVGNRVKSFGNRSLFRVGEQETILSRQIRIIRDRFTKAEIVLITGFESERVMAKTPLNVIKIENEKFEEDNVARSISIGLRACTTEKVFIIYGDLIFSDNVFNHYINKSYLLVDKHGLMADSSIGCNIYNDQVELLMYDQPNKWAQIGFFCGKELKLLQNVVWKKENSRLFGFEVINKVLEKNGRLQSIQDSHIRIFDVDCQKDLDKVHKL